MARGLNKTLHPVPKTADIEIIPGSLKQLSKLDWFFKWKRKGDNTTHHQKVRVGNHGNNYFKFEWV